MTKIASGVPIRPALAVRRRGWGNLYGGVERVEPVSGGAGRDPSERLGVIVERAKVPLASKPRRVVCRFGACGVCDGEGAPWGEVAGASIITHSVRNTLRHVTAIVHVVHAVAEVVSAGQHRRAGGGAHCAPGVEVLEHH